MGAKLKRLGVIAFIWFIGFLLGTAASFISPILVEISPQIFELKWVTWGLIGAFLAVICSIIYSYLT